MKTKLTTSEQNTIKAYCLDNLIDALVNKNASALLRFSNTLDGLNICEKNDIAKVFCIVADKIREFD